MKKISRKLRGKKADEQRENVADLDSEREHTESSSASALLLRNVRQQVASRLDSTAASQAEPSFEQPSTVNLDVVMDPSDPERSMRIVPPERPCPVCYNFDPRLVQLRVDPNDRGRLWAAVEFNIPKETPAGIITIERVQSLHDRAAGGCLYCSMVRTALGVIHPGWETQRTFIHIYLASGMPVIVRLLFGTTSKVVVGREAVRQLGVDIAADQQMVYTISMIDHNKPPIDVEIYRPRRVQDELTAADIALSPLVSHMGYLNDIEAHSGTQRCIDFIKEKVADCTQNHKCGKNGVAPLLPDRVLWIKSNNASGIRLVEPRGTRARYVALSYCWGAPGPNMFLTNVHTLAARKAGIHIQDLPTLFQEVVHFTRTIGIEYLWIDRLCIVQGEGGDWNDQAPKMGDIYGNASLTIASASAEDENGHILATRPDTSHAHDMSMNIGSIGSLDIRFRRRSHPVGVEQEGGDYGKVSKRAWIWQERILSARTVIFTPSAIKFECHAHSVWEGFDRGFAGPSWSAQLDKVSHDSWLTLVEEFMSRQITVPSDRLPAMNSVMKRIEGSTGWSSVWGLWSNAFVESLGWESKVSNYVGKHRCRMNPDHYAPSWSWASVDGPISYMLVKYSAATDITDPIAYALDVQQIDVATGLIRVAGKALMVEVECQVKRDLDDENNTSEHDGYQYRYNVRGLEEGGSSFRYDVPVMPWSGIVGGEFTSTIRRVPIKTPLPTRSWSGGCLCLMLGRRKLRCIVLFLGRSLREPGAWERIGIADGVQPEVFGTAPQQTISII